TSCKRGAVTLHMLIERPEPGAVAVELELPPVFRRLAAVEGVPARQQLVRRDRLATRLARDERVDLVGPCDDDIGAPAEEGVGAPGPARPTHRVGDERAVAEPAVPVDRK